MKLLLENKGGIPMKLPGPDHPIHIEPYEGTVSVTVGGAEIARSTRALALSEAAYPTVYYLPRADVAMESFQRSEKVSHCPYKGDAAHYTASVPGAAIENAAWSYEAPYGAVADIEGHLAFYPGQVEITAQPG
jgi:uncharacterized protein (DUF427 family)